MPKILVNYKYNKKEDSFKVLNYDHIFADIPVAVMEMDTEYDDILVVPIKNIPTIVEKEEYLKIHKKFYLKADENGRLYEAADGHPIYLPKDTKLEELIYINGQILKMDTSNAEVVKSEDNKNNEGGE